MKLQFCSLQFCLSVDKLNTQDFLLYYFYYKLLKHFRNINIGVYIFTFLSQVLAHTQGKYQAAQHWIADVHHGHALL